MKYLSWVIIIALLSWSWIAVNQEHKIPETLHVSLQLDLENIIIDYIQKELPHVSRIEFKKLWTEKLTDNRIKASFDYSFEETIERGGAVTTTLEGYAILNRDAKDQTSWNLDELNMLNNHFEFQKGLNISPGFVNESHQ